MRAEYVGEVEPIKISSLKVDSAGGAVCSGFSFERTGNLDIVNVDDAFESGLLIVADVDSNEDWSNLKNWTVAINGEPVGSRYSVSVDENGFRLFKKGFVFVVR